MGIEIDGARQFQAAGIVRHVGVGWVCVVEVQHGQANVEDSNDSKMGKQGKSGQRPHSWMNSLYGAPRGALLTRATLASFYCANRSQNEFSWLRFVLVSLEHSLSAFDLMDISSLSSSGSAFALS